VIEKIGMSLVDKNNYFGMDVYRYSKTNQHYVPTSNLQLPTSKLYSSTDAISSARPMTDRTNPGTMMT